ncbi:SEC10/PgrA surface exclusion domain-containing protein [Lactobacillus sp. ESL0785]|uniref:SEC10/PgrA surface exclusion domain-containing protein n=1 Tax=Lactobacillus sp. ESL0785 TaxID=2983232 RepID=UPI0023F9F73E|nr:SEC10/PgrA surface exclusion domain-containing protein [Lactobacillus sp. ESL0785]WEV70701.1 SEC10/PgrA surface exclusion domain-containing protein [Lactobacillus sp. ESL0785]
MNYRGRKQLIKVFLKNKKASRNLLVGTAALGGILGGLNMANNQVHAATQKTTQISVQSVKVVAKAAKLTKKSYVYNGKGKKIGKKALKKNKNIKVYGTKTIKGQAYYNLGNGKYLPAKKVKLATIVMTLEKTNIYNSQGKLTGKKTFKKGSKIKTYGIKTIKGRTYYSLGNGKYILAKSITPAVQKPAANKTKTPAAGSDTNNAGSVSSSAPNNSASMSKPGKPNSGSQASAGNSGTSVPGQVPTNNNNSANNSKPNKPHKPTNSGSSNAATGNGTGSSNTSSGSGSTADSNPGTPVTPPADNSGSSSSTASSVQKAAIKMPAGYKRAELLDAYKGHPSADFIEACKQGMKDNAFDKSDNVDSAGDDTTKVDPTNLTSEQEKEISSFTLRLINEARTALGLKPWIQSTGTQKLADDVAAEYTENDKSGFEGHYVDGIVRAARKNGLNIAGQYIEDMFTVSGYDKQMTLSDLKKVIYCGLTDMLFGGVDDSTSVANLGNSEWKHAGNLLGTETYSDGTTVNEDNDEDYFGISSTYVNGKFSIHYIHVSSYYINGAYGQQHNCMFDPGKDATGADIVVPNAGDSVAKEFSLKDFKTEIFKDLNNDRTDKGLAVIPRSKAYNQAVQQFVKQYTNSTDQPEHDLSYYYDQAGLKWNGYAMYTGTMGTSTIEFADRVFANLKNYIASNVTHVGIGAQVLSDGEILVYLVYTC